MGVCSTDLFHETVIQQAPKIGKGSRLRCDPLTPLTVWGKTECDACRRRDASWEGWKVISLPHSPMEKWYFLPLTDTHRYSY